MLTARRRLAVLAGLGVAIFLGLPGAALAHANLVRSEPAANADVAQAPARLQLWFSERPELKLTQVQVFDAQRKEVQTGGPASAPDDALSIVEQLQPGLPQGVYTVSWHSTSAVDGHVTGGAFAFGIGVAPTAADLTAAARAAAPPAFEPLSAVIRWLQYLGAVGLLGMAAFGLLVSSPAVVAGAGGAGELLRLLEQRLARAALALAILLLAGTFAGLLDQARRSGGGLSAASMQATVSSAIGENLLVRVGLGVAVLVLLLFRPQVTAIRALPGHRSLGAAAARELVTAPAMDLSRAALFAAVMAELLLFALNSHAEAVSNAPELALVNDWLHLTVAGLWIGGLIALAAAAVPALGTRSKPGAALGAEDMPRNQLFGPLITGFSRVALVSIVGLLITGFYQALVHVGSIENALDTAYGRALLVKSGIFAAALLLAGFHRWVLTPALVDPAKAGATRARRYLSRTLPLEALLVIAILAATGVLTSLPPANAEGSPSAQVRTLGNTRVSFDIVPLRVGPNLFQVTLTSKGKPVDNAQKVELQLTMLDMEMGQSVVDLEPRGDGVYAAEGDLLSMGGHWRVDLLLRLPGQLDERTSFTVVAKS